MFRTIAILVISLTLGACGLLPGGSGGKPASKAASSPFAANPGTRQCIAQLRQTGSQFEAVPDKYYGAGCSTLGAVQLERLGGDRTRFSLASIGPVTCPTANRFAGWARYGVDRAARQILGSALVRIETMGSYACRNIAGSNKRSAHSRAEAIDVSGFVLADGRHINVRTDWNGGTRAEREFLRTIHRSACKRFGTVLGPEYNAAHRNHFHLEFTGGNFCR